MFQRLTFIIIAMFCCMGSMASSGRVRAIIASRAFMKRWSIVCLLHRSLVSDGGGTGLMSCAMRNRRA